MKILHLCLADFYIDNYNYQANNLPRINREDGYDVRIIASTETYIDNLNLGYVEPSEYLTEYGVPIKRIPYTKVLSSFITQKFRKYHKLFEEISSYKPDVIMSHGLTYWSVLDIVRYIKKHPNVKFYADTHADYYTSGTNLLSKVVLHGIFYRFLVHKALPYLDKYFYISYGCKVFAEKEYGIPTSIMEFYPLGGNIISNEEYKKIRKETRDKLGIQQDELLLVHAGKLEANKKTEMLLRAFSNANSLNAKLVIIGSIPENVKTQILPLMKHNDRIVYAGWKSAAELDKYLCACDLYCQPGKVSAIMQNAVCLGCPVMLYPHPDYTNGYDYNNIIWVKTEKDIESAFESIYNGDISLPSLQKNSIRCAKELLDYHRLAARLCVEE